MDLFLLKIWSSMLKSLNYTSVFYIIYIISPFIPKILWITYESNHDKPLNLLTYLTNDQKCNYRKKSDSYNRTAEPWSLKLLPSSLNFNVVF